jgi:hypothetical protein
MLYTVEMAEVVSKRVATDWALTELGTQWRQLITRAVQDRPHPWARANRPAAEEAIAVTMRFTDLALTRAAQPSA